MADERIIQQVDELEPEAGEEPAVGPGGSTPGPGAESPVCEADALDGAAVGEPEQLGGEPAGAVDELALIAAQRDEYLALAQRTQADFENYRKRAARELGAAESRGVGKLVRELLPALDNLERAVGAAAADDPLLEGIKLVQADVATALTRLGVESFRPEGAPFDPAEHEAMAQQPVEGVAPGLVVDVYQAGYRMDGTVLRPARVIVSG